MALAFTAQPAEPLLSDAQQLAVDRISAASLREHVGFLSSDELEGRSTPSRGLDLAAEYIAAQFRRVGLEPAGDDGYYQTVDLAGLGERGARLLELAGPGVPTKARNVAGILRGSDAALRHTYVMLTAHYDHRRMAAQGQDRIFNGANDDSSGVAGVMEVAAALAALPVHPRRSILFVAFFGEESGLMGSRYYAEHPLVPLANTIALLNLEQLGRTDASDGPQIKTAAVTGFDFSDLPLILAEAGKLAGIRVFKDPQSSDPYFSRSDNRSLAEWGIPAHTLSVAYNFPDYHQVTDTWDKLDYDNMAAVNRAVALGLMKLASDAAPPQWNESYQPARRYVEAGKKLHP